MKKFLATILFAVYGFASSGATIELHYCMGRFIGLDLKHEQGRDCRNCGMQTKSQKGCCDNKQVEVRIAQDQQAAASQWVNDLACSLPAHAFPQMLEMILPSARFQAHFVHGPPVPSPAPVYLLHRNFRI